MKTALSWIIPLLCATIAWADIDADWAFHAAGDGTQMPLNVPGEDFRFRPDASAPVPDGETVTLYVLTARNFAGDMDEQIYVRWWDGTMSHWVMGGWVKNVVLDAAHPELQIQGQPSEGSVELDLWKIEIPPWVTQPGDNYYAIQLKGYADGASEERYLLSTAGGDFSQVNNLGQVWSASEEFDGQDWKLIIQP
jgi:hypothetical protein